MSNVNNAKTNRKNMSNTQIIKHIQNFGDILLKILSFLLLMRAGKETFGHRKRDANFIFLVTFD
jgi:hypothetical protein